MGLIGLALVVVSVINIIFDKNYGQKKFTKPDDDDVDATGE